MLLHTSLVGTTVDKGELIKVFQILLVHCRSQIYGARQQESEGGHYRDAVLCTQEILLSAQGSGGSRVNNIVQFGGAGVLKVQHNTTFKNHTPALLCSTCYLCSSMQHDHHLQAAVIH